MLVNRRDPNCSVNSLDKRKDTTYDCIVERHALVEATTKPQSGRILS